MPKYYIESPENQIETIVDAPTPVDACVKAIIKFKPNLLQGHFYLNQRGYEVWGKKEDSKLHVQDIIPALSAEVDEDADIYPDDFEGLNNEGDEWKG